MSYVRCWLSSTRLSSAQRALLLIFFLFFFLLFFVGFSPVRRQIIYLLVFVFILNHLVCVRIYVTPFSRVGLLVLFCSPLVPRRYFPVVVEFSVHKKEKERKKKIRHARKRESINKYASGIMGALFSYTGALAVMCTV